MFIDYINLINCKSKDYKKLSKWADKLRKLATEKNITIMTYKHKDRKDHETLY